MQWVYSLSRLGISTKISSVNGLNGENERPQTSARHENISNDRQMPLSNRTDINTRSDNILRDSHKCNPRYKFTKQKYMNALSYITKNCPASCLFMAQNRIITEKDLKKMQSTKENKQIKNTTRPISAYPANPQSHKRKSIDSEEEKGRLFAQFLISNTVTFRSNDTPLIKDVDFESSLMPAFKVTLPIRASTAKRKDRKEIKHSTIAFKKKPCNINYATLGVIPTYPASPSAIQAEKCIKRQYYHKESKCKNGIALTLQSPRQIIEDKKQENVSCVNALPSKIEAIIKEKPVSSNDIISLGMRSHR